MNDVAIVVMSCDPYKDLWNDFFALKKSNWNDCEFKTYLVTNNEKCMEDDVVTINCDEKLNWTGRLINCLNLINEKYVIIMLEDYYISKKVDNNLVFEAINYIKDNNVSYYKLETRGTAFPTKYSNKHIRLITPDIKYGVSLVTSIWEKDFLLSVINNEDYTAWEFEILRNRADDITKKSDKLCLCDIRNILNILHVVQRGKYIPSSVRKLKHYGYKIDTSKRGKLSVFFDMYLSIDKSLKKHTRLHRMLVKFFRLFGVKSISDKYEEEISKKMYK